jgi:hypothetical protein
LQPAVAATSNPGRTTLSVSTPAACNQLHSPGASYDTSLRLPKTATYTPKTEAADLAAGTAEYLVRVLVIRGRPSLAQTGLDRLCEVRGPPYQKPGGHLTIRP